MVLTATKLRAVLATTLVLIILLSASGLYLVLQQLTTFAGTVSQASGEAASGQTNLIALQKVSQILKTPNSQDAITRAQQIVSESKQYTYQEQVISDFNSFANDSGVIVSTINFITAGTSSTSSASAASIGTPLISTSTGGLKSTTISISLKDSVTYDSLLKFIRRIENNKSRMQISSLQMTFDQRDRTLTVSTMTIEVYTR